MFQDIQFLLDKGGVTAYVILFAGFCLFVIGLERINYLYFKVSFKAEEALVKIREAVLKREYTTALQVCNLQPSVPELQVIKQGLLAVDNGREAIRSALGAGVLGVTRQTEKRISIIALIASVSTLLGLLGTISGLIKTFAAIASADPSKKGELLGVGISEAMYATASGLIVGVIAMVIHTLCTAKVDEVITSCQESGYKLVNWIEEAERRPVNG